MLEEFAQDIWFPESLSILEQNVKVKIKVILIIIITIIIIIIITTSRKVSKTLDFFFQKRCLHKNPLTKLIFAYYRSFAKTGHKKETFEQLLSNTFIQDSSC